MILVKVLSKTAGCLHLKIQKHKNYELFSTDNAISVRFIYRSEPFAFYKHKRADRRTIYAFRT